MTYIAKMIEKYSKKGLLIDTNLLLLYVIGYYDKKRIERFKRTKIFSPDDYELLIDFLRYFDKIVTTPNILTEVSNLLNQLSGKLKKDNYSCFSEIINSFDEQYTTSAITSQLQHFIKFGLTDSDIIEKAKGKYLVLTDDFKLYNYLAKEKVAVINFNHIRIIN